MSYHEALFLLFGALFLCYVAFILWRIRREQQLERFLKTASFPDSYRRYLHNTAHYNLLTEAEQKKIERDMLRFIHTKEFKGIGLEVTDEMKTVVAFYACLMLLYKPGDWYDRLSSVLLYAEGFVVKRSFEEGGIVSSGAFELDGESSPDTVVLSWDDARAEAYERQPHNLIIHEFAHLLDFYNGSADGTPPMPSDDIDVLNRVYDNRIEKFPRGDIAPDNDLFGEYAFEHEAELFAVASERFFQVPQRFYEEEPELYRVLERFYGTGYGSV